MNIKEQNYSNIAPTPPKVITHSPTDSKYAYLPPNLAPVDGIKNRYKINPTVEPSYQPAPGISKRQLLNMPP